ncbi:hypothetical protein FORC087_442 (plasmid) [Bacillus cereus]|nr:hypothetical protein FORC087_442 [Bacillus cereus]
MKFLKIKREEGYNFFSLYRRWEYQLIFPKVKFWIGNLLF